jgi:hypothetical protein
MMFGGVFMMVFGLLALLLIIAVPVVLVVLLVRPQVGSNNPAASKVPPVASVGAPSGSCSHCSQSLQPGWTYCAQCGAPVQ